ncbi:SNF2-related protein [Bdellovibrionota bacterium FG-2]
MNSEQPRGPGGGPNPRHGRRGRRSRHGRNPAQPQGQQPGQPPGNPHGQPRPPVNPQNLVTLEQRCHRYFPRRARELGHDYFRTGRVSDPVKGENTFTVSVLGSGPSYAVVVDYSKAQEQKSAEIRCDCPYYAGGGLCKHSWATLLMIDKAGLNTEVPGTGPLRALHVKPRAPGEHPRPSAEKPVLRIPIASSWRLRLDQIQRVSGGRAANTFAGTWLAYFVINAAETISSGKLVIDLWSRDRLASGDLGVMRPNQPQDHELTRFSDVRDQEVLSLLLKTSKVQTFAPFGRTTAHAASRFTVDPMLESHLIPSLISAGKLFLSRSPNGSPDDAERPIRMDSGKPWDLQLEIEAEGSENYRLGGVLKRESETRSLGEPLYVFNSSFLLFNDRIGRLTNARQVPWVLALRSGEDFLIPRDQSDAFLARVLVDPAISTITWPEDTGWSRLALQPTPKGVFRPLGNTTLTGRMTLTVSFDYAGRNVSLDDTSQAFVDAEKKCVYARNEAFEEQTLTQALKILRDEQGTGTIPTPDLHRAASELSQAGWTIYVENKRLHVAQDYAININSSTDWFDLKMQASFAGASAGQPQLLAALEAKDGFVRLADGSLGALPSDWVSRYSSLNQFTEKTSEGGLRFNKSQGLMLHSALASDTNIQGDREFNAFAEKVKKFEGITTAKAPAGFKGKLRNYQKEGLSWLQFTEEFEMGGVLADDMGLGKTIQILAFLKGRKKKGELPSLVIAPKSLVFNWMDEAKKFVPDLNVMSYSGSGRLKSTKAMAKADLIVTTYGTVRTDIAKLQELEFDVAIVDEAQAIKNPQSQSAMAVKLIKANLKLALTGTPIENSLTDLFSILEFTSPGLINIPTGKELSNDSRATLSRMLRPFILRRTKEKVLKELPEKSEQVLYCEMSAAERDIYAQLRDHYRASLTGQIETSGLGKSKIHVLEALLRLRQASCHPGLINPAEKSIASAKLSLLLNQIQEVIQEGHKALVFSQFTSLLAIVRETFDAQNIVYEYLDGQTVDRKSPVERFQTDPKCPVFLISLKAGGTGLNLTAADYVFILDPWWNPAVEAQAIGRAHRIGQANKVFAYRMITRGTVEEKIIDLQKTKKELAESVFSEDGTSFMKKLTREDLEMLLT